MQVRLTASLRARLVGFRLPAGTRLPVGRGRASPAIGDEFTSSRINGLTKCEQGMEATKRVLELLYDRGDIFFEMDELSRQAGVSRDELDRTLEHLRGVQHIEHVPGRGIRLVRPIRLDAHLVERGLGTRRVGRHVICFGEVESTSDVAFDSARHRDGDGLVVLAEFQRGGRGRQGRRWISPRGANVLCSVVLIDKVASGGHDLLTIATGLAVAQGVESATDQACQLKWPNDVLLDGEKVAGVLVELRSSVHRRCVVLGVGINVNAAPPAGQVDRPATSLAEHLGHPVERTEVIREVLRRLDWWVHRLSGADLGLLHDAWVSRCNMLNDRIDVLCAAERYTGRVLDVSPMDGLILQCDDGQRVHLPAESSTVLD